MKAWQRQLQETQAREADERARLNREAAQLRIENEAAALIERIRAAGNKGNRKTQRRMRALERLTGQMVGLERYRGVSWEVTWARVIELCLRWHVSTLWAEENATSAVNIELLSMAGVPVRPFVTTLRSKPTLINGLAVALERGELSLQPEPILLEELAAYRMSPMAGGGYKYSAPVGGHDDTVIALALAWHGARQGRIGLDFA